MPDQKCAVCGVRPKKGESSKGYFTVPTENMTKAKWQDVIPSEVTPSSRVCFRHWAREDLEISVATKVTFKKGMYSTI